MNSVIQFSGGRTSAYMLRLLLDWNGGKLPDDWVVCFENTGKEREETLEFIEEVSQRWTVPVVWLEYAEFFDPTEYIKSDGSQSFRRVTKRGVRFNIVNFKTASRNGEPFECLIEQARSIRKQKSEPAILPNPKQRICTAHLKIKTCNSYLRSLGWSEWDSYIGIRYDERHRQQRMLGWMPARENLCCPLVEACITKAEVIRYWGASSFNLKLDPQSDEGNCDLCFLKSTGKLIRIAEAHPQMIDWWVRQEVSTGANFSQQKISFQHLKQMIEVKDPELDRFRDVDIDKGFDCFCGD